METDWEYTFHNKPKVTMTGVEKNAKRYEFMRYCLCHPENMAIENALERAIAMKKFDAETNPTEAQLDDIIDDAMENGQ